MDSELFYKTLEAKQSIIIERLDAYFAVAISGEDQETKNNALIMLGKSAGDLIQQIASSAIPRWLKDIHALGQSCESASSSEIWSRAFVLIKAHERAIRAHKWRQQRVSTIDPIIDFDGLVEKYRDKEKVQKLFAKLIESIESLIGCDELDSRRVINDLERILATVRKSMKGSFSSQILSVDFAKRYFKNLAISWLKNTNTAKVMIEAAEKTVDELDTTIDDAQKQIQSEINAIGQSLEKRLTISSRGQLALDSDLDDTESGNNVVSLDSPS